MLSFFLRAGSRNSINSAFHCPSEKDAELHTDVAATTDRTETVSDDLPGLLSDITANAEFLAFIYGENRNLKTILHAVGEAKRLLREEAP